MRVATFALFLAGTMAVAGTPSVPARAAEGNVPPPATEAEAAPHQRTLVALAVERYIRPAYANVADAANGLRTATVRYCAQPSATNMKGLENAFRDTVVAWGGVDFLRFGPATTDHRLERISFWPDPRNFVERQLRTLLASPDLDSFDLDRLKGQSAAVQGLPAFERLMLAPGKDGAEKVDPDSDAFSRRCRLAGLIATNIGDIADTIRDAWIDPDGISHQMLQPGPDDPLYRTEAEAADEILKALLTGIEQVRDLAITPALGATPEDARPLRFPYVRSGDTLALIAANITGLRQLIEASGIADNLRPEQSWLRTSLLFELGNAERVLKSIDEPPMEMAADPKSRAKLNYVRITLGSIRDTIAGPLASAVGLNVGFNALDGD